MVGKFADPHLRVPELPAIDNRPELSSHRRVVVQP